MRSFIPGTLAAAVLIASASPSDAGVRNYCAAYARDQAEARITPGSILSTVRPRQPEADERRQFAELAFANCLALYAPRTAEPPDGTDGTASTESPPSETEAPSQTVSADGTQKKADPTLTASAELVPGSEAWNDYCAAKYASFNRETGTYTSFSGKERPCLVTRN